MATQAANSQEILSERNKYLPDLISSLQDENHCKKQLENIRQCLMYLKTFTINEVDSQLFQWVMPVVEVCLKKIYDDNSLLISTADDDFILDMVKENLRSAMGYLEAVKIILQYIAENVPISIKNVNSVPVRTGRMIICSFEHCKNSSESFKITFKDDLLELFRLTQEVHTLYLQLLESSNLIESIQDDETDLDILREVVNIICDLSGILSDMNIKSMIGNWKSYLGLSQKYSDILENSIDLVSPIKSLMGEIMRNLSTLSNMDKMQHNFQPNATRVINISSFLVKVAIKLFEIYCKILDRVSEEFLLFCCSIYSFPPEFFQSEDFPPATMDLITNNIFKPLELFISNLASDQILMKVIETENFSFGSVSYGLLKFLSISLQNVVERSCNYNNFKLDIILRIIFDCIRCCPFELYWSSPSENSLFDDLIVNISAAAIICKHSFFEVEKVLIENILQEHTFSALLAIEIWDLLLSNSSPHFRINYVRILIDILENLQFGNNTYKLESIHLQHFILRICNNLSPNDTMAVIGNTQAGMGNRRTGGSLGPLIHQQGAENLCRHTVELISNISHRDFSLDDLLMMGQNFEALSKVSLLDLHVDINPLVNAVAAIWELNHNGISNNIFKYFTTKLCKITRTLILEFPASQLFMILNQLKVLSSDATYKVQICNILMTICDNNINHLGQDVHKILSLIANIIYSNILTSPEAIVKLYGLEITDGLHKNNKHDIVRDIMNASKETQGELANYLRKNTVKEQFDKNYFVWLTNLRYRHECVNWTVAIAQPAKKMKVLPAIEKPKQKLLPTRTQEPVVPATEIKTQEERADDITEAIANLRNDVKYLMNLMKSQKLTPKNVCDLKLVTNQLLALM